MTRNFLQLLLIGLAAGLLASGCIINSGDDPCDGISCDGHGTCLEDNQGKAFCDCATNYHAEGLHCVFDGYNIEFTWSLDDGKTCSQALAGSVKVEIIQNTQTLASDTYDCSVGGATVSQVEDGNYTIDLTAIGNNGQDFYFGSKDATVNGQDVDAGDIVLDSIGTAKFQWEFGTTGLDCLDSGVSRVKIKIDNQDLMDAPYQADPVPDCEELEHSIGNFLFGRYTLKLEGICETSLEAGYTFDGFIDIERNGENDFGVITLEDTGGC